MSYRADDFPGNTVWCIALTRIMIHCAELHSDQHEDRPVCATLTALTHLELSRDSGSGADSLLARPIVEMARGLSDDTVVAAVILIAP